MVVTVHTTDIFYVTVCNTFKQQICHSYEQQHQNESHVNTRYPGHCYMGYKKQNHVMSLIKYKIKLHLQKYITLHIILCPQGGRLLKKKREVTGKFFFHKRKGPVPPQLL